MTLLTDRRTEEKEEDRVGSQIDKVIVMLTIGQQPIKFNASGSKDDQIIIILVSGSVQHQVFRFWDTEVAERCWDFSKCGCAFQTW